MSYILPARTASGAGVPGRGKDHVPRRRAAPHRGHWRGMTRALGTYVLRLLLFSSATQAAASACDDGPEHE